MKQIYIIAALLFCLLETPRLHADSPIQPGDRITIVGNTFADKMRIHGYLETLLLQQNAENPVSIRNLGWGGDMLTARDRPTNFPSEESTLTTHKTDVIIACFGLGESFAGEERTADFQADLKAFIASHAGTKYNGESAVRLVLVSPIAYEDLGDLTPAHEKRNRELRAYTNAMREVAAEANVPFVDLFSTSRYLMDEPKGPNLTTNGIHLTPYGYWAISHTFLKQLIAGDRFSYPEPWKLSANIQTQVLTVSGVDISGLTTDGKVVSFLVKETSAPSLPPPTEDALPEHLQYNRDTLQVENLSPGTYQLTIDDKPVTTATADAWAAGVPIDSSPAHVAAEKYRAAVNDKNLQFTYGWKALNQVHIVGERKSSPSGRRLPQEIIEFNRLANERDAALRKGIELKTRHWRLTRVPAP